MGSWLYFPYDFTLECSFIWGIKVLLVEQNLVDGNACYQITGRSAGSLWADFGWFWMIE